MSSFSLPTDTDSAQRATIDKDALRQFAAGAKDHRTDQEPPPWEKYEPDEVPKNNVSVRLNDHQLEKLRYLAKVRGISQQKILNAILLPALEEQAEEAYRG
jgi:hypothetical protein